MFFFGRFRFVFVVRLVSSRLVSSRAIRDARVYTIAHIHNGLVCFFN